MAPLPRKRPQLSPAQTAATTPSPEPTPSKREIATWTDALDPGTLRILLKAASDRDALVAESLRETVQFPGELDRLVALDFSHHHNAVKSELHRQHAGGFNAELAAAPRVGALVTNSIDIITGQVRPSSTYATKFGAADVLLNIANDVYWSETAVASRVWARCQHRLGSALGELLGLFAGEEKGRVRNEGGGEWFERLRTLVYLNEEQNVAFRDMVPVLERLNWYAGGDGDGSVGVDGGGKKAVCAEWGRYWHVEFEEEQPLLALEDY